MIRRILPFIGRGIGLLSDALSKESESTKIGKPCLVQIGVTSCVEN